MNVYTFIENGRLSGKNIRWQTHRTTLEFRV